MQDALLYSTSNQLQRRDAAEALATVLPAMKWEEEERILDVGCGSGDVTVSLLFQSIPVKHKMVGLDCSEEMVKFASNSYQTDDISFLCLDISKDVYPRSRFPDGFHKAFSLYCLHWIRDLSGCIRNIFDLLVDGGEAMFLFIASNPLFRMYRQMAANSKWAEFMKDCEVFIPVYQDSSNPEEEFAKILRSAGFNILTCKVTNQTFKYINQNQLAKAVVSVNPFIRRIPKGRQTDYLNDCLSILAAMDTVNKNSVTEARYNLLVAHVLKPQFQF